jgi:hypothetical protein
MLDAYSRGGPGHESCRYGDSRLAFRGPQTEPAGTYIAALGGSATFGKHVELPWPALLGRIARVRCVNLGSMHAGATAFADDPSLLEICSGARVTVLQMTGAHCLDNVYYSLHPRRNDRFIDATAKLRALYPEVDFTRFHFVRHLLAGLEATSPGRFVQIVDALRREWVERMRDLVRSIDGPVILLWMSERGPELPRAPAAELIRSDDPLFVDRDMIRAIRREAAGFVEVIASPDAAAAGLQGKLVAPGDERSALAMPGPLFHAEAATALYDAVMPYLPRRRSRARRSTRQSFSVSSGTAVKRSATRP